MYGSRHVTLVLGSLGTNLDAVLMFRVRSVCHPNGSPGIGAPVENVPEYRYDRVDDVSFLPEV